MISNAKFGGMWEVQEFGKYWVLRAGGGGYVQNINFSMKSPMG